MAVVIWRGYSWESGGKMIPDADLTSHPEMVVNSTGSAKTGTRSLHIGQASAAGAWRIPFDDTPADPAVSLWMYNHEGYSQERLWLHINTDVGDDIKFEWISENHTFDAYVGSSKVASGTVEVMMNDWFHVQIYVVLADAGYIGVKIDGVLSIDYSGDTLTAGAAGATYIAGTLDYGLGASAEYYIDDLVIGSGGFLGVLYCDEIMPNADTVVADFDLSTGTDHYALINEIPPDTADYVYTQADAQEDEVELGAWDDTDKIVKLVDPWIYAQDVDANGSKLKVGLDSNGTEVETEHALSSAWRWYWHDGVELNPDDSAVWEDADIEALKLRYKSVIT